LSAIIPRGAKVVIKPNWVHHANASGQGLVCLVTHISVIEAILCYVAKAQPEHIIIGDSPVQGCDFAALMASCRAPEMIGRFRAHDVNVSIKDFRRTVHENGRLGGRARDAGKPMHEFILFDLGVDSALEEITTASSQYRVTMYDPDALGRTHGPGRHQYLIARDVIDADVVINVPKLKTHRKACITGALKNLVGINGHKEYLPHHRKGCTEDGGDCYSGKSRLKSVVEDLLDATNRAEGIVARSMFANAARIGMAATKLLGESSNYEGSWHGNDTVWRTCLDLQRVVHYGQTDGQMAEDVRRSVVTITDGIIAGEGEGPLAPTPIKLGILTLGLNTAAVDWVHALLMGLEPQDVPLTREAFVPHRYPLAGFRPQDIVVWVDDQQMPTADIFGRHGRAFQVPRGWEGYSGLAASRRLDATAQAV
jgi:uncharacterized protein (DUF362 family)